MTAAPYIIVAITGEGFEIRLRGQRWSSVKTYDEALEEIKHMKHLSELQWSRCR